MKNLLHYIDLRRISGIKTILGIDVNETAVHMAELERIGPIFNRFKSTFRIVKLISREFGAASTTSEKADLLKHMIEESSISTRFAASVIRSQGVKAVTSKVPPGVRNIAEWIEENHERLLRLPIPLSELSYTYDMIDSAETGLTVQISFVRKSEVEERKALFREAGLQLIFLGVDGKSNMEGKEPTARDEHGSFVDSTALSTEHRQAAAMAIKGFSPEVSGANLVSDKDKEDLEASIYQSLTKRAIIACGSTLIVLLTLPTIAGWLFQSKLAEVEDEVFARGASFAEIAALEKQVGELDRQLEGSSKNVNRARLAKVMHDVAQAAPADVWLSKLSVDRSNQDQPTLSMSGYTTSAERITDFLKNLGRFCFNVQLVRSGAPLPSDNLFPVRVKSDEYLTFTIKAQVR